MPGPCARLPSQHFPAGPRPSARRQAGTPLLTRLQRLHAAQFDLQLTRLDLLYGLRACRPGCTARRRAEVAAAAALGAQRGGPRLAAAGAGRGAVALLAALAPRLALGPLEAAVWFEVRAVLICQGRVGWVRCRVGEAHAPAGVAAAPPPGQLLHGHEVKPAAAIDTEALIQAGRLTPAMPDPPQAPLLPSP